MESNSPSTLFKIKDSTNITFANTLIETETLNPYTYKNFYNGGGVAIGDINNDGLEDIFFTGNLVNNKLYLNKGNWKFEDITDNANVGSDDVWSSGVTFVDINHDGFLDIYVCKAGPPSNKPNRHNELFINNGDLTFTEQSKKYGLDFVGLAVQANFFDYDKDGDLDCYLLNNSIRSVGNYDLIKDQRLKSTTSGNKFLKNENGVFIDVTEEANIYSSAIGFGLGITVSDYDNDDWPDIFISNDFFERDYLYINQKDGTFKENLQNQFNSISMGSMGADAADLDNDSNIDIMVTEMLPKSLNRQRTKTLFESWNKYDLAVKKGYHHQFSRNALHKNLGDSTFLEISRFSNVAASEWSWASLLFDADNDGYKDIFISNGIAKDLLDRDYLVYMANEDQIREMIKNDKNVMEKLINLMPSKPVSNAAFKNLGDFQFEDVAKKWGLEQPSFSNGSAYGDLDNDGDLDLVVNNINSEAFIYENTTDTTTNKSITIKLKGSNQNTKAIGAKAEIFYNNTYSVLENYPSRGFESSISNHLLFGVNNSNKIDSLIITWPNNTVTKVSDLKTNKTYEFFQDEANTTTLQNNTKDDQILKSVTPIFNFIHNENHAVDFNREQLLPEMYNNEGPKMITADINNDNILDIYICGAKGQSGKLFISSKNNIFKEVSQPFLANAKSEDTKAIFLDSDNDGDLDLYVTSGSKEFSKFDFSLNDRLYVNDGNENFTISNTVLPFKTPISTSVATAYDYDQDGDLDIFLGERFKVETYGLPASGYILKNNGKNNFELIQPKALQNIGLITDAAWEDFNNDGVKDLIIVGEWMPISIFINQNGTLVNKTEDYGFEDTNGFWKTLKLADVDHDGKTDIIVGNKGTNTFFKKGLKMFVSDFDNNGSAEQIICHQLNDKYYPILDRDELIAQLPSLKQKLLYYKDYANADINSIFTEKQLNKAYKTRINRVKTSLFLNKNNTFKEIKLPSQIQYSNVEAIEVLDANNDGLNDIIFGGNQYLVKPQFGRQDASKGWIVYGDKKQPFKTAKSLNINGQIRDFKTLRLNNKNYILTTINNSSLKFYEILHN